jgi:hypothetical protein
MNAEIKNAIAEEQPLSTQELVHKKNDIDTRERLKKLGHKGQTYDELINKLLDLRSEKVESFDLRVDSLKSIP